MSNKLETGIQYMQEGNWEEAAKNFTEAIEENPKDALGYINFANLLDVLGDSERAILFYKRALELDDKSAAAYYGLEMYIMAKSNLLKRKLYLNKQCKLDYNQLM